MATHAGSSLRRLVGLVSALLLLIGVRPVFSQLSTGDPDSELHQLLGAYWEDYLLHDPITATFIGDTRYNDRLPIDITQSHRSRMEAFYVRYLDALHEIDRTELSEANQINYDLLEHELTIGREWLTFNSHLMPIDQFNSFTLFFPVLGSGASAQPFATVGNYDDFLNRIDSFVVWVDTAIVNMRRGIALDHVLPRMLAEKVLPQLETQIVSDAMESVFYGPVKNMPSEFSEADSARLANAYSTAIQDKIVPAYRRLHEFMQGEYLPRTRSTSGISALPNGKELYAFLSRVFTTTDLTPDEIFEIGMREVERIKVEMNNVRKDVGFQGDLQAFFEHVRTSPEMYPFKTDEDVLDAYRAIEARIQPNVAKLFARTPKAGFEIRQTEAFRAASASEEYVRPSEDGSRPGVFYVPIVDATRYQVTNMENIFLHEAIPGHHFQLALQIEQGELPAFRRFGGYSAYTEGWGLYAESLGGDLGLYTDPYQYLGRLMAEMHRALRLVVDVGLHVKGWTRDEAIQFMLENNPMEEAEVTREVERYMAMPAQALSYKIGELKILELRKRAEEALGDSFDIRAFHEEILKDGALPLSVLEEKIERWIGAQV